MDEEETRLRLEVMADRIDYLERAVERLIRVTERLKDISDPRHNGR